MLDALSKGKIQQNAQRKRNICFYMYKMELFDEERLLIYFSPHKVTS